MEQTYTGNEIATIITGIISQRMRRKLAPKLFRSRTDIQPAINKLRQDIDQLKHEIHQNKQAIKFLAQLGDNK